MILNFNFLFKIIPFHLLVIGIFQLYGNCNCGLTSILPTALPPNLFVQPPIPDDVANDEDFFNIKQNQLLMMTAGNGGGGDGVGGGDADGLDPELRPGLFQGDMAMDNEMYKFWRVGIRWDIFPEKLWTNGTVPYVISPLYEPESHIIIYEAIRTIQFMTCIKFQRWNGHDKDFLLIWPIKYPAGCWSYVGKIGGPQLIGLQAPDARGPNCLGDKGRAIHEILHALGIFHEQSRGDRDRFIKIHWNNILTGFKVNFQKQSLANTTYAFEYDFNSIMHYGKYYFSKGKDKPTITSKMGNGNVMGQRKTMSKTDCLKVNDLYRCLDDPRNYKRYYGICRILGL